MSQNGRNLRRQAIRVEAGKRTILGTDWPVFSTVTRLTRAGKPIGRRQWLVTYGICNGVASGSYRCPTRGEALELAEAYAAGPAEWENAVDRLCRSPHGEPACKP